MVNVVNALAHDPESQLTSSLLGQAFHKNTSLFGDYTPLWFDFILFILFISFVLIDWLF